MATIHVGTVGEDMRGEGLGEHLKTEKQCLVTHLRMVCRETKDKSFSMSETIGAISR